MDQSALIAINRRVPRYTSYPTAPHFSPSVTGGRYGEWLERLPADQPVSVYVHIPFCASLCWYCGCSTRVVRGLRPVEDFLDLLAQEVDLVAARLPGPVPLAHLHLGGGTPNQLSDAQMARLMDILGRVFIRQPGAEISVELDPRLLTPDHVAALAALGVTRASLGVQDFDPRVQQAINRVQPFEVVATAAARLREAGIAALNFDLIYGLPYQTVTGAKRTAEMAASLMPDRISVFGYAHVPWMKKHQTLIPESSLPDPDARREQEAAVADRLEGLGYVRIGLDHFALPGDSMTQSLRDGALRRNFQGYTTDTCDSLIGLGPSSISRLPSGYAQNDADFPAWRAALREGRLPVVRGHALDRQDHFRAAIIERLMCDLTVDLAAVAAAHGMALDSLPLDELDPLIAAGLCVRDGATVTMTPGSRSLVRLVAAVFDSYLDHGAMRHSLAV